MTFWIALICGIPPFFFVLSHLWKKDLADMRRGAALSCCEKCGDEFDDPSYPACYVCGHWSESCHKAQLMTKARELALEERIRERAHEIWHMRGCLDGFAQEDWLIAEIEVHRESA